MAYLTPCLALGSPGLALEPGSLDTHLLSFLTPLASHVLSLQSCFRQLYCAWSSEVCGPHALSRHQLLPITLLMSPSYLQLRILNTGILFPPSAAHSWRCLTPWMVYLLQNWSRLPEVSSILSILPLSLCNPVHPLAPSQLSLGVGSSFDWGGFSNLSYLHGRDGLGLVGLQLPSLWGPLSESRCYIMHITCSVPLPFLIQANSFHPFVFMCLYLACCLAVHKWHHCLSLQCFSSYFVEA